MKKRPAVKKGKYVPTKNVRRYVIGGQADPFANPGYEQPINVGESNSGVYSDADGKTYGMNNGMSAQQGMAVGTAALAGGANINRIYQNPESTFDQKYKANSQGAGAVVGAINPVYGAINQAEMKATGPIKSYLDKKAPQLSFILGNTFKPLESMSTSASEGVWTPKQYEEKLAKESAQQNQMMARMGGRMPMYANGGAYNNFAESSKPWEIGEPNAELEKSEVFTNNGSVVKLDKKPSHENGGFQLNLDAGDRILSDKLKVNGMTFAKLGAKFNTKKEDRILLDPKATPTAINTANINKEFKLKATDRLFADQEQMKQDKYMASINRASKKYGINPQTELPNASNGQYRDGGEYGHGRTDLTNYNTVMNANDISNLNQYEEGGIHIKPSHVGRFTAYKERTGKTTEEALHSPNPHVRQMANFARNAAKWKHEMGGVQKFVEGGSYIENGVQINETDDNWDFTKQAAWDVQTAKDIESERQDDSVPYNIQPNSPPPAVGVNRVASIATPSGTPRVVTAGYDPLNPAKPFIPNPVTANPRFTNKDQYGNPIGGPAGYGMANETVPKKPWESGNNAPKKNTQKQPFNYGQIPYGDISSSAANLLGPAAYLMGEGKRHDKVDYGRIIPSMVNYDQARRDANIATKMAMNQRRNMGLGAGAYMSGVGMDIASGQMAKGRISEAESNANVGIQNAALAQNQEYKIRGMQDEAANKGKALTNYYKAIDDIGKNTAGAFKDYKAGQMDMNTAKMLSSAFANYGLDINNPNHWSVYYKKMNENQNLGAMSMANDPTNVPANPNYSKSLSPWTINKGKK